MGERDHPAHRRLRSRSRQRCCFHTAGRRECTHIDTKAAVISRASGESRVNKVYPSPRSGSEAGSTSEIFPKRRRAAALVSSLFEQRSRANCGGGHLVQFDQSRPSGPPIPAAPSWRAYSADASRGPNDTVRSGAQEVQRRVRGLAPMAGPLLVSLTLSPGLAGPRYCCLLQPLRRWPAQMQRKRSAMRPCCCMLGGCGSHCAGGAGGQTSGQSVGHDG